MTIQDYDVATLLLQDIDKLNDTLVRVQENLIVQAQAEALNNFIDIAQLKTDIETEINSQIAVAQAAFDAL